MSLNGLVNSEGVVQVDPKRQRQDDQNDDQAGINISNHMLHISVHKNASAWLAGVIIHLNFRTVIA